MSHLPKDIEDLYRKYIEDWIEGAVQKDAEHFHDTIFYKKDNKVLFILNKEKGVFCIDLDFYDFLDNSIGINKISNILEEIVKGYSKLETCRFTYKHPLLNRIMLRVIWEERLKDLGLMNNI